PSRSVLVDLLEHVVVSVEKEAEPRREAVDLHPASETGVDVREAVGQSEGQLLNRGGAGFANVIAADAHRVPLRHLLRAKLDHIRDQANRRLRRKDEFILRMKFLEDVILQRAPQ